MNNIQNFIQTLREKPFIKLLINDLGSDIYVVGGATRDLILNKPNKDIDLVIRKTPIDTIISTLEKFGKVDIVGKSFGVIKFIDSDGVDYDIALPRTDKKNDEGGYRGFDIQSDENLPIESDLIRRDAKLNAMAININTGKFIDPLGGLRDIENKQLSAANPDAFSDDPLRMFRLIGFSSRFGFKIEPVTMKAIMDNASRIREIPADRILTEFKKIVDKGNPLMGAILLDHTGLYKEIFGKSRYYDFEDESSGFANINTFGEFMFLLMNGTINDPDLFFRNHLRGDNDSYNEIRAYKLAFEKYGTLNNIDARIIAHNMYKISPISIESNILPESIKNACNDLLSGRYPKTTTELALRGNDFIELGFNGKSIGDSQKMLLLMIYSDAITNNREDLLKIMNEKKFGNMDTKVKLTEEIEMKDVEYSAIVLEEKSRAKLIDKFKDQIPDGWEILADHMTIKMGELPDNEKKLIGWLYQLGVDTLAMDDKVMAVGVSGYPSNNINPHITIAVNRENAGKPFMINNLTNWEKTLRFKVTGRLTEVKYKIREKL